jgi:hypothetical protein
MRLALVGLLALAACDAGTRPHDPTADAAAPDEDVCVDPTPYVPIAIQGTSPAGSLSSLRSLSGLWWPCGMYDVVLVEGTACEEGLGPQLRLHMSADVTTPGADVPVTVTYGDLEAMGSFHIGRLDPDAITGHFVVTAAGWNLDLDVDVDPEYASCTLPRGPSVDEDGFKVSQTLEPAPAP